MSKPIKQVPKPELEPQQEKEVLKEVLNQHQWRTRVIESILVMAAIFSIIALGYAIGLVVNSNKFDKDKADLTILDNELQDTIRHLKLQMKNEEINKDNWILQHTNNIYFNKDSEAPTLAVTTTSLPCISGKINSCWNVETEIFKDDTLSLQLYYRNDNNFPVADVRGVIAYQEVYKRHFIGFTAQLSVGEIPVLRGGAIVYYSLNSKYNIKLLPKLTKFYSSANNVKVIDGAPFFQDYYELGELQPHENGVFVFNFKVLKNN